MSSIIEKNNSTKRDNIVLNYIYNLSYQILVIVLPLITTPYISRVLGAENIGIYSYTISVTTYFILFGSLGISMYGQREIAYLQEKKQQYSKVFWEIIILRFITMAFSMMTFYFIFVVKNQYSIYYSILLLEMLANCIDISWFFQGLEEFKKIVLRNMVVKIISVICIFIFVKTSNDLIIYFWIYVLSTLIANISLWMYLPKYLSKVKIKEVNILKHLKPTISLFIPQIAIQIYTVLDKVMIGSIIPNKAEVGFYDQSQKIVKMLLMIITSISTVMAPRMANKFINKEFTEIKDYMLKSINFVFFISFPMMFGIIIISNNFVPVFFGNGYEKVSLLMNIISPIFIAIGLSNVIGNQFLLPQKRQKEYTISVIIGAISNFIFNFILIKKNGAVGASIATVIAEIIVTMVQLYFIRNTIKILEILKLSTKYIISSILMYIICILIGKLIPKATIRMIFQMIFGVIIYIGTLVTLKDKFIYIVINKFQNKIIKIGDKNEKI